LDQQPSQRNLGRCRPLPLCDGAEQIDQGLIRLQASGVKRGRVLRKSVLSKVVFASIFPVRNPLPSGL
jgi:hypothetical protein